MTEPDHRATRNRLLASASQVIATATNETGNALSQRLHMDEQIFARQPVNALVVEDSPQIAERLVELVSIPGRVEVVATAATEDEALAACARHPVALAIVDLQLAQGTGFGVIRKLRSTAGEHPACIVVLTNHASPALKRAAFEVGADYFLDKSKDFARIPGLIEEFLSSRGIG